MKIYINSKSNTVKTNRTVSANKEYPELGYCPNCGGDRFNYKLGFCVDCGYDENEWGSNYDDYDDYDD